MDSHPVELVHVADTEGAYDAPERVGRLAAGIEECRTEHSLVVGAGDDGAVGALAIYGDGKEEAVPFLDAADAAAETFGNHEFDDGPAAARDFADATDAQFLCANADVGSEGAAVVSVGERRVGLVGVANPETPRFCPAAADVEFRDPVAAVEREAAACREAGADFVVALSHCGSGDESIAFETDVDAVLGGHDHRRHVEWTSNTLVVRTAGVGAEFATVTLGDGRPRARVVDAERFDPDAEVAARYRERRAELGLDEVVATVDPPVERDRAARRAGESRIGNFVADAYRGAVAADLGLVPSASIRDGPALSGPVTVADVVNVVPFEGPVTALDLPGSALRRTLEAAGGPDDDEWVEFHVAGLRARWDDRGTLREARVGGDRVREGRRYRVATAPYCCAADAYPTLDAGAAVAEGPTQYEAVLAHARDGGLDVTLSGRIGRVSDS